MFAVKDVRKIERMPLKHTDDVEQQLRGEVLAKAFETFGYRADEFGAQGPLARVLIEADIAPLKADQVNLYMASKERTLMSRGVRNHLIVQAVILCACAAAAAFFGFGIAMPIAIGAAAGLSFMNWMLWIPIGIGSAKREMRWAKFSLGHARGYEPYNRYVPVHVLNMALAVRERCPNATLVVHELSLAERKVEVPLPDPFLEVVYGSERYYIAVWDEREFEAKM